ncbi:MAG: hypothetical protein WC437_04850 [Patescibacteria group bacterium]
MHVILFKDIRYDVTYTYICFDTRLLSFGYYDHEFRLQKEITLQEVYSILNLPAQKKGVKNWKIIYYRNPTLPIERIFLITETKFSYFGFTAQGQWVAILMKKPTEPRRINTFAGIRHYTKGPCYEKAWLLEERLKYPNAGIYPPRNLDTLYTRCIPLGLNIREPFWFWLWKNNHLPIINGIPMDKLVSQDRFVDYLIEKNKELTPL